MRMGWCVLYCGLALSVRLHAETLVLPDVQVTLVENVQVPAREPGIVSHIRVRPGDRVTSGQILLEMDDRLLRPQWQAAELRLATKQLENEDNVDLRFAEKSRAVAQAEFTRLSQAVKQYDKSVSQSELDQARLVLERAELAEEQAGREAQVRQLALEAARKESEELALRLQWLQVESPADGLVVEVMPHTGEWLPAGAPAVRVIRLDRLRVEGFVDGNACDANLQGAPARLVVPSPRNEQAEEFSGHVTFVSPELNPVSGQVRIWADVDNPRGTLRPGMRGQLTIVQAPDGLPGDQGSELQP